MKFLKNLTVLIVFAMVGVLTPTIVFAEYFIIKDYQVTIHINKDGSLDVNEKILVDFEIQRQGIFRTIPYRTKIDGKRRQIRIYNIRANDKMKITREFDDVKIRLGTKGVYREGEGLYDISYKIDHVLLTDNTNYDELYWNAIGTDWAVPIYNSRIVITFPEKVAVGDNIDYRVYVGDYGDDKSFDKQAIVRGRQIIFDRTEKLSEYQGITMQIRMKKGMIKVSGFKRFLYIIRYFLLQYWHITLSAIVILLSTLIWYKHGKDKKVSVMVEYVPPKDISPADAKSILKQGATMDISSTLVDLAQRGYMKIGKDKSREDYILRTEKPYGSEMREYEKELLDKLFDGSYASGENNNLVYTDDLEDCFYSDYAAVQGVYETDFSAKGYFEKRGDNWQTAFIVFAVFAVIGIFIALVVAGHPAKMIIFCAISALNFFLFALIMPKKSLKGLEAFQKVMGFREFVRRAEADKIRRMLQEDPHYFDATIPYAIVFGMAKRWGRMFEGIIKEPPNWYTGYHTGTFLAGSFARDLSHTVGDFASSAVSQPSSSGSGSSGGFSGGSFGGSVGGGFGGGGGGSW